MHLPNQITITMREGFHRNNYWIIVIKFFEFIRINDTSLKRINKMRSLLVIRIGHEKINY